MNATELENTIYELFEEGHTLNKIAKILDIDGVDKEYVKMIVETRYYVSSRKRKGDIDIGELKELAKTKSIDELCEHYNMNKDKMYYHLRRYGIKAHRKSRKGQRLGERTKDIIAKIKSSNFTTYEELAQELGVSRQYVHKIDKTFVE